MSIQDLHEKKLAVNAKLQEQAERAGTPEFDQAAWDTVTADYEEADKAVKVALRAKEISDSQEEVIDQRVAALKGSGLSVSPDQVREEKRTKGEIENLAINAWARRSFLKGEASDEDQKLIGNFDSTLDEINFKLNKRVMSMKHVGTGLEMRAQATSPDSAGGFTIAEGFIDQLEQRMLFFGPMQELAFTLRTSKGNDLPMPTTDDTANKGAVLAENAAVTEQDVVFAQVLFGAFKYESKLVKVSFELLEDSEFDMSSLLADLLGERLGRITNEHLTTGTGSGQMEGAVTGASAGNTTVAIAAVTADELIDFNHTLDIAYRNQGTFVFNDATIADIRKLKGSDNNFLWQSGLALGRPDTLLGAPVLANNDMAVQGTGNKFGLFGDFSKYWHRQVNNIRVLVLSELFRANDQTGYISFMRQDAKVIQSEAIKFIDNA